MSRAESSVRRSRKPASADRSAEFTQPQIIEAEVVEHDPRWSSGLPCRACGCPRDPHARFCVACGLPFEVPNEPLSPGSTNGKTSSSSSPSGPTSTKTFHCESCGADVVTTQQERSFTCPFCDSSYVAEVTLDTGRQRPEFVIGFAIDHARAQQLFFEWLGKNSWFRPSDLKTQSLTDKQRGVYLPFWHFTMKAHSRWSASIGEHWYRTETYTYRDKDGKTHTATRQVQETEWWPLSGEHDKYYYGYLVSASKGLPQKEAMAIQPYQLSALVRYRPLYLAGWLSEEYSVDSPQAIQVAEEEFKRRQQRAVASFLPGDTHQDLHVDTDLAMTGSDLILLPVHVLSYRYRDRQYRFLVNGQTGKFYGEKPWSAIRIGIAIVFGLLLILLVFLAIFLFNQLQ